MTASSVTGVGAGAGFSNKGPHNGRDVYVPINSTHIVASGAHTLAAGTYTVTFPEPLPGNASNYVVIVTPQAASTTVPVVTTKTTTSGNFVSFVMTGANVSHAYLVVATGHAFNV